MRLMALFLLGFFLIFSLLACKEVYRTSSDPGVNVMVQDLPCEEAIQGILKVCQTRNFTFEWIDQGGERLSIGPVISAPLASDPFTKIEERVQLAMKCTDPLSLRISLTIQLRGLTSNNLWQDIKDTEKLNTYGKRFLGQLLNP
jgi:hypothetical protein